MTVRLKYSISSIDLREIDLRNCIVNQKRLIKYRCAFKSKPFRDSLVIYFCVVRDRVIPFMVTVVVSDAVKEIPFIFCRSVYTLEELLGVSKKYASLSIKNASYTASSMGMVRIPASVFGIEIF